MARSIKKSGSGEMAGVFLASAIASCVLMFGPTLASGKQMRLISSQLPMGVDRVFEQAVLYILVPLVTISTFKLAQDVATVAVAVPFIMSARDHIEDVNVKSKDDAVLLKKGLDRLDIARKTIIRMQILMLVAGTIFAMSAAYGVTQAISVGRKINWANAASDMKDKIGSIGINPRR